MLSNKIRGGHSCKIVFGITMLALMLAGVTSATTFTVNASGGADYTKIQDAIDNASGGDTILVYSSTYYENVNVTKRLTIRGIGMPVLDASGSAIMLAADGIILEGLNVTGAGFYSGAGIKVISNNNTMIGNNASISLYSSSNNTLIGNNASNNGYGIHLESSNNNTLSGNSVSNNCGSTSFPCGIVLTGNNNTLSGNNALNNQGYYGIGISLSGNNNRLIGNNANSNSGKFTGGISLSGNNNTLSGNNASNNIGYGNFPGSGIGLSGDNNTLSENNASNNYRGISLSGNNNTLNGNNASNNGYSGISPEGNNNMLSGNIMNGNGYNFRLSGSSDSDFDNQIDTTNLVDGKPVYYLKGARDMVYDSSANAGTFYCISCVNVTFKNLDLKNNGIGIFFWNTTHSKIQNSNASLSLSSSSNNTLTGINASRIYIYGSTRNYGDGIYLESSNNNTLIGNNASNNGWSGIWLVVSSYNTLIGNNASNNGMFGINLESSSNNTLIGNNASNNYNFYGGAAGIGLSSSNNNMLSGNNASNNYYGIGLYSSSKSVLINNIMNGNGYNFKLDGSSDSDFDNQIDATNLVDGKPVYYIKDAIDIVYDSSTNAGTFTCISCVNVTLIDLDLKSNGNGIFFWNTTRSKIQNVNASNNDKNGISLSDSSNNMLSGNIANSNNNNDGIYLSSSSNNTLIGNNASNGRSGIGLRDSSNDNMLIGNNVSNNWYGIDLSSSSNNTMSGNTANSNKNDGIGISLYFSGNNRIYNNHFNNTNNVQDDGNNFWNTTKTPGTNIISGTYLGGNFWANPDGTGFSQTCIDVNKDGICDASYVLDANNIDYLPLTFPPTIPSISFTDPTPADGATLSQNYAYINTTIFDASTAFIDWNRSLAGWWRLNGETGETSTFFRDWSTWGNNATCSGTNCPASTSGKSGNALSFDGVNDHVDAGNGARLDITGAITIEAWINPGLAQEKCWDGASGNYGVMSKVSAPVNSANWSWQLRYGSPGNGCYLGFNFNGNPEGGKWVTVKQNLTPGQWYHVVGTFDGTDIKSYLDGNLTDTNKISAIRGYSNKLLIGNDGWGNYFNGKIDEVRIHRRALSAEEIKASCDTGIYRLYRNFTNLANGDYNYQPFAQNKAGKVNQTEKRTLNVSKAPTLPVISFIDPTSENGAILNQNDAYINTTVSDAATAFIDWNRSLAGWWRFNSESGENSSYFMDWSSWRNNATCSGTDCPASTPGKFGIALNFDGVDDAITVPNSASLNPSNITVGVWFNAVSGSLSTQKSLIQKPYTSHTNPYYQYMLSLIDTGTYPKTATFYITINGVLQYGEAKNLGFGYGQWHYLVGTYNGSNISLYLDGILVDSKAASGTLNSYNTVLQFGAYPNLNKNPSYVFNGKLDEVRIHNRPLRAEEIKASYEAGIYRLYGNFTNLSEGSYNYQAYAQDLAGNVNQTEIRTLTLSS